MQHGASGLPARRRSAPGFPQWLQGGQHRHARGQSAIRQASNVRPETLDRFDRRRELAEKPGEELWRMPRDFSDESRDADYAGDIDHRYADGLIEALGRCGVPDAAQVCSLLSSPEVEEEWLEVFLVDLAGVRRTREAIPQLVAKLHIDTDYLLERVCKALARIGDPDAAIGIYNMGGPGSGCGGLPCIRLFYGFFGWKAHAAGTAQWVYHDDSENSYVWPGDES